MTAERTVAHLLGEALAHLGVARVFGLPVPGLHHVPVDDHDVAVLLADADGRLGRSLGAALLPGPLLHLSSRPGGLAHPQVVGSAEELVGALGTRRGLEVPDTYALHLDLDLSEPAPPGLAPEVEEEPAILLTLAAELADARILVLAGPGVVRGGFGATVHAFATAAAAPVVNTWGAKGLYPWDHPHHGGTVGLQAADLELVGVEGYDLVVASGLDPAELPPAGLGAALVQEVEPWQLATLAHGWPEPHGEPERPPFYGALADALAPAYRSHEVPVPAARAARELAGARPAGGVVAGEPGPAGFWLARAFPTAEAGTCVVPATRCEGIAAALALVAALEGRPAVAVTHELGDATGRVLDLARQRGWPIHLQVWGSEGALGGATELADRAAAAFTRPGTTTGAVVVEPLPIDLSTAAVEAVAGPVVAWT